MQLRYKTALAAGFVGAVAFAATAFGQPGTTSEPTGAKTEASEKQAEKRQAKEARRAERGKRVVTSETKVQMPDGSFGVWVVDSGEVTEASGSTITIKRADGETVQATATDATKVARNGEKANVSDFKPGDRARIFRMTKGDETTVRAIVGHSADFEPRARGKGSHRGRGNGLHKPPKGPKGDAAAPEDS